MVCFQKDAYVLAILAKMDFSNASFHTVLVIWKVIIFLNFWYVPIVLVFQILFLILPTAGGILGPQVEAGLALVRRVISLVARKMLGPGNTTVRTLHAEKRGACATIFQGKIFENSTKQGWNLQLLWMSLCMVLSFLEKSTTTSSFKQNCIFNFLNIN